MAKKNQLKWWHFAIIVIAILLITKYEPTQQMAIGQLQSIVGEALDCSPQPDATIIFKANYDAMPIECDGVVKPALVNVYHCNNNPTTGIPDPDCGWGRTELSDFEFMMTGDTLSIPGLSVGQYYIHDCYGGCTEQPDECTPDTSYCRTLHEYQTCLSSGVWGGVQSCGSLDCQPTLSSQSNPCSDDCTPKIEAGLTSDAACEAWDAHSCGIPITNSQKTAACIPECEIIDSVYDSDTGYCEPDVEPTTPPPVPPPVVTVDCDNDECEAGETYISCPEDCEKGSVPEVLPITVKLKDMPRVVVTNVVVLNDLEGTDDRVNPGGNVFVAVTLKNYGDAVETDLNLEVGVYPKKVIGVAFPTLASVLGREGINLLPETCENEPFVTAVKIDPSYPLQPSAEKTFVISVKAPETGDTVMSGDAYEGPGDYNVNAGLYDECGVGYYNGIDLINEFVYKYVPIELTEEDLVTHKAWYGFEVSCIEVNGAGTDECNQVTPPGGSDDVTGTCKEPINLEAIARGGTDTWWKKAQVTVATWFGDELRCSVSLTKEDYEEVELLSETTAIKTVKSAMCIDTNNCKPYPGATVKCLNENAIIKKTGVNPNKGTGFEFAEWWSIPEAGLCFADVPEDGEFDFEQWFRDNSTVVIAGLVVAVLVGIAMAMTKKKGGR